MKTVALVKTEETTVRRGRCPNAQAQKMTMRLACGCEAVSLQFPAFHVDNDDGTRTTKWSPPERMKCPTHGW